MAGLSQSSGNTASNIGEKVKEIDYNKEVDLDLARQRMAVARYRLLNKEPFYGTIAVNLLMTMVEKDHPKVRTMGVDGRHLYYNPNCVDVLDDEELLFIIAHEVLHCVLGHLTRRGKRDPLTWNIAGDYLINYILVRDSIGKFPGIGGVYNPDYGNMVTEELYEIIRQDLMGGGGSHGGGGGSHGGGGGSHGNGPGDSGNFDDHFEVTISESGDENSDSEGDTVTMTPEQAEEFENEMVASIMQAVDAAKKQAGSVPAEIERLINEFLEPKLNWRDIVRETAKAQVTSDYTWKRPNRKFLSQGFVIPGRTVDDHFDFVIGIDASGSMSNEQLRDFLSEIYGIADSFMSFRVGIFTFDTKVYNYQEFDQNSIDDLLEYVPKGGGGTDFMCCWEFFEKNDIVPETFIMLTDGMPFGKWGVEDYCDTVFLIHDRHAINNKVKAPFGTTLYYDDFET